MQTFQTVKELVVDEQTPANFVQTAIEHELLDEVTKEPILAFCEVVATARPDLKQALQRSTLADEVLPSFSFLSTTVDLRPSFEEGRIKFVVPVALLFLATDASEQQVWCQLKKSQLEEVIKDLQTTLRQMEQAEQWAETVSSSNGGDV